MTAITNENPSTDRSLHAVVAGLRPGDRVRTHWRGLEPLEGVVEAEQGVLMVGPRVLRRLSGIPSGALVDVEVLGHVVRVGERPQFSEADLELGWGQPEVRGAGEIDCDDVIQSLSRIVSLAARLISEVSSHGGLDGPLTVGDVDIMQANLDRVREGVERR